MVFSHFFVWDHFHYDLVDPHFHNTFTPYFLTEQHFWFGTGILVLPKVVRFPVGLQPSSYPFFVGCSWLVICSIFGPGFGVTLLPFPLFLRPWKGSFGSPFCLSPLSRPYVYPLFSAVYCAAFLFPFLFCCCGDEMLVPNFLPRPAKTQGSLPLALRCLFPSRNPFR